jgi:glycosyltransferase involved in cell wall biosynthesis
LKRAHFVVIPLRKTFRSVGVSAILEAMALGKAIITAKVSGTIDYIRTGIGGLFYEPGNSSDLKSKILKLSNDPDFRKRLGKAGQALVKKGFNKQSYSLAMFKALSEICGGA